MSVSLRLRLCLSAPLLLAAALAAQQAPVGFRDVTFQDPSAAETVLPARVFYPATRAGWQTPILPRKGGHPLVLFLPGQAKRGNDYVGLGVRLARRGYVAVMSNELHPQLGVQLEREAQLHPALVAANRDSLSFFHGAFDESAFGIAGHSRGAFSALRILANNPGFLAGVGFAPWPGAPGESAADYAKYTQVPFAAIVGRGDKVTPLGKGALPVYQSLVRFAGLKLLFALGEEANHANIAAWFFPGARPIDKQVFDRSTGVGIAFFDHYLKRDERALDVIWRTDEETYPRPTDLKVDVHDPAYWKVGRARVGQSVRIRLAGKPGFAAHMASAAPGFHVTPIGVLHLDPRFLTMLAYDVVGERGLSELVLPVPNDPRLRGVRVTLQGVAVGRYHLPRFSNGLELRIER